METINHKGKNFVVKVDARELTNWIRGTNSRQGRLVRTFDRFGLDIEHKFQDKAEIVVFSGVLHNSAYSDVKISSNLDNIELNAGLKAPYAVDALTGIAPKDAPRPDDPKLRRWVKKKLGVPDEKADWVAGKIARKIARVGSKRYREGPDLLEQLFNELDSEGIVENYANEIGEIIIE